MIFLSSRKMRFLMRSQSHYDLWQPNDYPELGLLQAIVLYYGALVCRFQVCRASRALKKVKESTGRRIKYFKPSKLHFLSVPQHSKSVFSCATLPLESVASVDGTRLLYELLQCVLVKSKDQFEVPFLFESFKYPFVSQKCLTYSRNPFDSLFLLESFEPLFQVREILIKVPFLFEGVSFPFLEPGKFNAKSNFRGTNPLVFNEQNRVFCLAKHPLVSLKVLNSRVCSSNHLSLPEQGRNFHKVSNQFTPSPKPRTFSTSIQSDTLEQCGHRGVAPQLFLKKQHDFGAPHRRVIFNPPSLRPRIGEFRESLLEPVRCKITRQAPNEFPQISRIQANSFPNLSLSDAFISTKVESVQEHDHSSEATLHHEGENDLYTTDLTVIDLASQETSKLEAPLDIDIDGGFHEKVTALGTSLHPEDGIRFLQEFPLRDSITSGTRRNNNTSNNNELPVDNIKDNNSNEKGSHWKCDLSVEEKLKLTRLLSTYDQLPTLLSTSYTSIGTIKCNFSVEIDIEDFNRNKLTIQKSVPSVLEKPCQLDSGRTLVETDNKSTNVETKLEEEGNEDSYAAQKAFYDYINFRDESIDAEQCDEDDEAPSSSGSEFDYDEAEKKVNEEFRKKLMLFSATDHKLHQKYRGPPPKSIYSMDVPQSSKDRWEVRKYDVTFEQRKVRDNVKTESERGRKVQFADTFLQCTYERTDNFEFIGRNELPPVFRHRPTKSILKKSCKNSKEVEKRLPETSIHNLISTMPNDMDKETMSKEPLKQNMYGPLNESKEENISPETQKSEKPDHAVEELRNGESDYKQTQ